MALKPCRECGKETSTEAAACPHCGVPHPAQGYEQEIGAGDIHGRGEGLFSRSLNCGCLITLVVLAMAAWAVLQDRWN